MGFLEKLRKSVSSTRSMEDMLNSLECLRGFTVESFDTNCFNVFGNPYYYDVMGEHSTIGVFYEGRKFSTTIGFDSGKYGDIKKLETIINNHDWERKYQAEAIKDEHGNLLVLEYPREISILELEDAIKELLPLNIQVLNELKGVSAIVKASSKEENYDDELKQIITNEPNLKGFRVSYFDVNEYVLSRNFVFAKYFGEEYSITCSYHDGIASFKLNSEPHKGNITKIQNACLIYGYGLIYDVSVSEEDDGSLLLIMKKKSPVPVDKLKDAIHELSTAFMMVLRHQ